MASWKAKEKPLTPEEAIALARKELAKYWFGSDPLLAAVEAPGKPMAYPLHSKFASQPWLLIFLDPTQFASQTIINALHEWHRRYSPHELGFLVIYFPPYKLMRQPEFISRLLRLNPHPYISALDAEGLLSRAFSVSNFPKLLLLQRGEVLYEHQGCDSLNRVELQIQKHLRKNDPGIPFPPVSKDALKGTKDLEKIEFSNPKLYPAPGFVPGPGGLLVGRLGLQMMNPLEEIHGFFIKGNWLKIDDRIITSDPKALISILTSAKTVSLIAHSASKEGKPSDVSVEINGSVPYEEIMGEDLKPNESGKVVVSVGEVRSYQLLVKLSADSREISFRFPTADRHPIGLLGLRFGG